MNIKLFWYNPLLICYIQNSNVFQIDSIQIQCFWVPLRFLHRTLSHYVSILCHKKKKSNARENTITTCYCPGKLPLQHVIGIHRLPINKILPSCLPFCDGKYRWPMDNGTELFLAILSIKSEDIDLGSVSHLFPVLPSETLEPS